MHDPGIPLIDVAPFLEGSAAGKRIVAEQAGRACEDIGFFTIVGHGVSKDLIDQMYDVSKAFFDLPMTEKMKVKRPWPDRAPGYFPVGSRTLAYTLDTETPPDLLEGFAIGPIDMPDEDYYRCAAASPHFAPNVWPERPAALKPVWTEYFRVLAKLAADTMRIFAVALELPEAFFADKIDKHTSVLRVNRYPEQPQEPLPGQLRAGAHSDYGSLTILRMDEAPGGLQVRNRRGEWVDVQPIADSFVVNIGDMMMNWTNDRWISTLHRVVNPPRDKAFGSSRQSIVFFHMPNYDAVISCLESCHGLDNPAKHPPITAGDHKLMKFRKSFAKPQGVAAR